MSDPADNNPQLPKSDEPELNNNSRGQTMSSEFDPNAAQGDLDSQELRDETGSDDGTASDDASVSSGAEVDDNDVESVEDAPPPSDGSRKRAAEAELADSSSKKARATPPTPTMEIRNCSIRASSSSTGGGIIIENCPISGCSIIGAQISNCNVDNCAISHTHVRHCSVSSSSIIVDQIRNCTISNSVVEGPQLINCNSSNSSISGISRQTNDNSGLDFGTPSLFMIDGHSFRGSTGRFNGFQNSAIRTGRMVIPSGEPLNVQIQRNTIGNDLQVVLGPTTVIITPRAGTSPRDFNAYRDSVGQMVIEWGNPRRDTSSRTQNNNSSSYSYQYEWSTNCRIM